MVVHRVGAIWPGEAYRAGGGAAAAHRGQAFDAVRTLMDYLKTDAPLWKKETGPDGARWIEPTIMTICAAPRRDKARRRQQ